VVHELMRSATSGVCYAIIIR